MVFESVRQVLVDPLKPLLGNDTGNPRAVFLFEIVVRERVVVLPHLLRELERSELASRAAFVRPIV